MEWPSGMRLLSSLDFNGTQYHLVVYKVVDSITTWYVRVVMGAWQVSYDLQSAIAQVGFPDQGLTPIDIDAEMVNKLAILNKALTTHFGGIIPVTFAEKMEAALSALKIILKDGIPQISK